MKQIEKKKQELKSTAYHEKQFHRNRYRYSKQTVSDTFGKVDVEPSYDKQTADHFTLPLTASTNKLITHNLIGSPTFQPPQTMQISHILTMHPSDHVILGVSSASPTKSQHLAQMESHTTHFSNLIAHITFWPPCSTKCSSLVHIRLLGENQW